MDEPIYCHACGNHPVDPVAPYEGLGVFCRVCFIEEDQRSEGAEAGVPWLEEHRLRETGDVLEIRFPRPMSVDLTGRRFGRLVVVGLEVIQRGSRRAPRREWLLRCDCGEHLHAATTRILGGEPRMCRSCWAASRSRELKGTCPVNRTPTTPGVVPQRRRVA